VPALDPTPHGSDPAVEVSVVVPAYREQARLPESLRRLVPELEAAGVAVREVLVVDDGSDDDTSGVATRAAATEPRIRVLRTPKNRGKGHAVRTGVLEARAPFVLVTDADLSTPPGDVVGLLAAARRGFPVAIGSRRVRGSRIVVPQPLHREAIGFVFAALRRLLVLPTVRDTQCGFKLFRADAAKALFSACREDRFVFDVEVLLLARTMRIPVAEVPVRWADDPRSQVAAVSASTSMAFGLLRLAGRRLAFAMDRARGKAARGPTILS
jgi:dolichyl-phosphate beta-glucosyltransferase